MAEIIGISSGLLTLVAFALQSSRLLCRTVKDFRSSQRTIRELVEQLEALEIVLESLNDAVTNTSVDLSSLKLPVLRCGKACEELKTIMDQCVAHSGKPKVSFRDWAKLKYMGDDILAFKNTVAGYKSTITIALCDINM